MAIDIKDTVALMQAMERIKAPASAILDTFFPNIPTPAVTDKIAVEYRKGGRKLAPYIVNGAHGVNVAREGSTVNIYKPPVVAPRRIVAPEDIEQRGFGETIFSTVTPAQRAVQIQARDLADLQAMIINRKNQIAAEILTTGGYAIKGYADDGSTVITDTIAFDWNGVTKPTKSWSDAGADIYGDIKAASLKIQESAGVVPTIMFVGSNVGEYLLNNEAILKWLNVPSNSNLTMFSFAPRITSPQVMRIGLIPALNLEVYMYAETYLDDEGKATPFIGADDVIIGVPGRGKQLHGAVTLIDDGATGFETYSAQYVPQYIADKFNNEMSLTVYSRFLLAPEFADDWVYIKSVNN